MVYVIGAGVDSAWEQKKLKIKKMLKKPQDPQLQVQVLLSAARISSNFICQIGVDHIVFFDNWNSAAFNTCQDILAVCLSGLNLEPIC
mgnify:CR=1 FL=1